MTVSETKKPAAGGGAAGFFKKLNNGWEEECRCSVRRPLGGGTGRLKHEALREEVHCFVELKISEAVPTASAQIAVQLCTCCNAVSITGS